MNIYYVERFLEKREQERNDRITEALKGSMTPPDAAIINSLKEKSVNTYERTTKNWSH